jgi:hypothetical protein
MINLYVKELTSKCDEHNMFHRMEDILCLTDYLEKDEFAFLMNSWDVEFMELMLHSENEVSKFMMGYIEWSPTIGIWLSRRWLLQRVHQLMEGYGPPDSRNMFRDCYRLNIPNPHGSTYETVCIQIVVTNNKIHRLAKDAPALCKQHLLDLIEEKEKDSDSIRAQAIVEILR